jgi:Holliday junction resolvasome RuvABC endonuclease subunit
LALTRVIGLDLSLTQSGWAWSDAETAEAPITAICPKFPATPTDPLLEIKRLKHILNWVRDMVKPPQETLVVLEGISFASKSAVADQIAGMHYLIRFWLFQCDIDYLVVAPSTLKKFVLGTGAGKKEQMLKAVFQRWGMDLQTSDEADAVGLVYIGRAFLGGWQCTTDAQRQVIKDLKKKNPHLLD